MSLSSLHRSIAGRRRTAVCGPRVAGQRHPRADGRHPPLAHPMCRVNPRRRRTQLAGRTHHPDTPRQALPQSRETDARVETTRTATDAAICEYAGCMCTCVHVCAYLPLDTPPPPPPPLPTPSPDEPYLPSQPFSLPHPPPPLPPTIIPTQTVQTTTQYIEPSQDLIPIRSCLLRQRYVRANTILHSGCTIINQPTYITHIRTLGLSTVTTMVQLGIPS